MSKKSQLSRREAEVAQLYADGKSYKEIAELLFVAPATVRTHINTIYRKLEISNKLDLARLFNENAMHVSEPAPMPMDGTATSIARPDHLVETFLEKLGLQRYAQDFATNAVDMEVLRTLDDNDLRELGVLALGDRKRLTAAISSISSNLDASPSKNAKLDEQPQAAVERRHLTIAFIDLVGSTRLSAQLDPEEYREILATYHRTVADDIALLEGHVANVVGDGILAFFGWPGAHEDDAERAVRAALSVKASVGKLVGVRSEPLDVRIGIASGICVVSPGLGSDADVAGDTPNLASRLQGLANPGQIIASTETARLLPEYVDTGSPSEARVKGFDRNVGFVEVIGLSTQFAGRFDARAGPSVAPMIGCELELGLLRECWRRTVSGEGQIALINGDPGIGKSRLLRALQEADDVAPKSQGAVHCSPFHTQVAFHPLKDLLVRTLCDEMEATPEAQRQTLRALLNAAPASSELTFSAMARLASIADEADPAGRDAKEERIATLDGLTSLLLGSPDQQPRLILVEDIHWIDPSSQELLDLVIDLVPTRPVFLVMTARPEFIPFWQRSSHVTSLSLGRLDRDQARQLVDQFAEVGKLPPPTSDQIVARADGVPLFLEELSKAVVDRESRKDVQASDQPISDASADIPETLHDMLMSRLDRMPTVKAIAQTAAVIGRHFDDELLAAIGGYSPAELKSGIDALLRAGLINRQIDSSSDRYLFKHALIRDEAYQALSIRVRRRLHKRIFQELEKEQESSLGGDDRELGAKDSALLAYHASLAEDRLNAARYHHQAGVAARQLWAIDEAIDHFKRAIDAIEQLGSKTPKETGQLGATMMVTILSLCECLYFAGNFLESYNALDAHRDGLQAIDDPELRGRAHCWLARLTSRIGMEGPIRQLCEQAIADSLSCGDKVTTANAYNVLCVERFFAGAPDESIAAGRRAIAILQAEGSGEPIGFAYHYISMAQFFAGRFAATFDTTKKTLEIADKIDHPRLRCYGLAMRALSLGMSGHHQDALKLLEEARNLAPDEATRIFSTGYKGYIQLEAGAFEKSVDNLETAHTQCLSFPSPQLAALFGAGLAEALRRLDQTERARAVANKSLDVATTASFPFGAGLSLRVLGRLAVASVVKATTAVDFLERAAGQFAAAGAKFELARTYVDLAAIGARPPADGDVAPDYDEFAKRLMREVTPQSSGV